MRESNQTRFATLTLGGEEQKMIPGALVESKNDLITAVVIIS